MILELLHSVHLLNSPSWLCPGMQRGSSALPCPSVLHCLDNIPVTTRFPIQIVIRIQLLVCFTDLHSSHQQFLVPLLIEKLDSDVQNAKVDSLQTLVKHIPAYSGFLANTQSNE